MNDRFGGARGLNGNHFGDGSFANQGDITVHSTNHFYSPSPHQLVTTPQKPCVRLGLFPQRVNFVERLGLREELWRMLPDDVEHEQVALWGLPGSGKTQLALQYAHQRFRPLKCSVFWVDARNEASFLASIRDIAERALFDTVLNDDSVLLNSVRACIQSQPRWVLVLDGADDVSLFAQGYEGRVRPREFLPDGYNGTVIWTSRDRRVLELGRAMKCLPVDSMTLPEAVSLLQITANRGDRYQDANEVESLVQELQLSPLAISYAATWMRERSLIPKEMLTSLGSGPQRAEILTWPQINPDRPRDNPRSILDVFITPMFTLYDRDVWASSIIANVAFMDHLAIPRKIAHASQEAGDELSARRAIDLFKDLTLLRDSRVRGAMGPTFDMPLFVQEAIRHHLRGICLNRRLNALRVIDNEFPREMCYATMDLCGSLVGHALKVTQLPSQDYDQSSHTAVADLSSRVGDYLCFCGRWQEMEVPYQRSLEVLRQHLGAHDPRTVAAMDKLAWACMKLGKLDGALELFWDARDIRVNRLRMEMKDPEVTISDMNVGVVYREQDRLDEAEELFVGTLKRQNRFLGQNHPDTVQTKIELAERYGRENPEKAVNMLKDALRHQSRSFGENDPRTMQTRSYLGFYQASHDDFRDDSPAGKALRSVLGRQQELLGKRHPHTLETQASLGFVLLKQSRFDDAASVLREATTLYDEVLGQTHPKAKEAWLMLADVYLKQSDFERAAAIQKRILDDNRRLLGPLHRDTLTAQVDLSRTYFSMDRKKESRELAWVAYKTLRDTYGLIDEDTVRAAEWLAELRGDRNVQ